VFQVTTCGQSYGWHETAEQLGYGGSLFTIVSDALFMARGWSDLAHLDPKWEKLAQQRHKGEYTK